MLSAHLINGWSQLSVKIRSTAQGYDYARVVGEEANAQP